MESQGLTTPARQDEQFDSTPAAAIETTHTPTPEPISEQADTIAEQNADEQTTAQEQETVVAQATQEAEIETDATTEIADPAEAVTETDTDVAETTEAVTEVAAEVDMVPEPSEPNQESADEAATINPYAGKTQAEILDTLSEMLQSRPIQNLRSDIEAIKIAFYKIGRAQTELQRIAFVEAGGSEEDFKPEENLQELRFKEFLTLYREKRDQYLHNSEVEKEKAYAAKLQIIEELKELINGSETVGNTFNTFRTLQQRWKEAGLVPQEKIKDLWETYHHHVENFYNYVKINKELRDLDLKKNYETKLAIAEESEALMLDPSATVAFHKLQKLHDAWREAGPVAPEVKDALWDRFKEASTQINKRHQAYFEGVKDEQKQNLALKSELCLKVEALALGSFATRAAWNEASEQIVEIQKIWKTIGFAPKKENTKIYDRFRAACDNFFEAKRKFYHEVKSEIEDNLQAKLDLCVQAEALQESEDWKAVTDTLIALQKQWKEIGATSRKHSEVVWKRFRAACDKFFARKAEHFGNQDSKYNENLARKQQILEDLRTAAHSKVDVTFDKIKEYQRQWSEIGFVPAKQKDQIQSEYRKVVDQLFDLLRGEDRDRQINNFREKVVKIQQSGIRKVNQERERLYNKVRQIESDIQIWENNIGFFAKSKNAEALMREVQNKITKAKEQITTIVEKVKLIDQEDAAPAASTPKKEAKVATETPVTATTTAPVSAPQDEPTTTPEVTPVAEVADATPKTTPAATPVLTSDDNSSEQTTTEQPQA